MATVFYDQAAVRIITPYGVEETLLATDCSVNFSASQTPLYSIGKKGSLGQFPSAARAGDVSFNFLTTITGDANDGKCKVGGVPKAGNIINYMASGIKNSTNSLASGCIIQVAGLSGTGFLNSYSFNIGSNTISSSSASFTLFGSGAAQTPVIGRLAGSSYAPDGNTGLLATGVAHGRFTSLGTPFQTVLSGPTDNGTVFGADYSISFNHNPVYKIGQEFPTTTFYTTAAESVNVTEDIFNSGLAFDETPTDATMVIKSLNNSAVGSMHVGLKGLKQQSTSMSAGLDDIVRSQKTLTTTY
jgi:hypothetical protein